MFLKERPRPRKVYVLKDRFKTNHRQQKLINITCFAVTTWKDALKFLSLHSTLALGSYNKIYN